MDITETSIVRPLISGLMVIDLENKNFELKTLNIFLPISFYICFGAQKNRLIETVLLSTHNICFG